MSAIKPAVLSIPTLICLAFATVAWSSRPLHAQAVVTTIPVEGGSAGVAVNPRTNRIYVLGSGHVSVIDGRTDAVVATIAVGTGGVPLGVAVNQRTDRVYVVGGETVSVIDGSTETLLTNIAPHAFTLRGGAVNINTNRIYATSRLGSTVSVINGNTDTFVTNIAMRPKGEPFGVAVNLRTNRIYVADQDGTVVNGVFFSRLWVIDGRTDAFLDTILIPALGHPSGVAVNSRTNRVYVANGDGNTVSVVDGASNALIGTPISVGRSPFGVAVNPRLNRIYVANAQSNTLSVIDGATSAVIGTPIPVGTLPTGVAVNPRTNRVYVANAVSRAVSVLQDGCVDGDRDGEKPRRHGDADGETHQGHDGRCDDS